MLVSAGAFESWYFVMISPSSLRIMSHVSTPGNLSYWKNSQTCQHYSITLYAQFLGEKLLHIAKDPIVSLTSAPYSVVVCLKLFFVVWDFGPTIPFFSGISILGFSSHHLSITWCVGNVNHSFASDFIEKPWLFTIKTIHSYQANGLLALEPLITFPDPIGL